MIKIFKSPRVIVVTLLAIAALAVFGKVLYGHWQEQEERAEWKQAFTLKKPS